MQKLAEICVHRPVFATMLIAAITVVGGVSFFTLGVDRYPRVETPVVSVQTRPTRGATPESDRDGGHRSHRGGGQHRRRHRRAALGRRREGSSRVTITFDLSKDPDVAAQEVRAKVDPVIRDLPETADPPVVQKQDPDSQPIMLYLDLGADAGGRADDLHRAERPEADRVGQRRRRSHPLRRAAPRDAGQDRSRPPHRRTACRPTTSRRRSRAQNLELPGGRLEQGTRDLSVRTVGRLQRPTDFEDLVVATRDNYADPHPRHRHGRGQRRAPPARSRC